MIFAGISYIFILPLVVILLCMLGYRFFIVKKQVNLLSSPEHRILLLKNFSLLKTVIRIILLCCVAVLLWIALLRPQYPTESSEQTFEQGRDVVIALDISRSMSAQDDTPNRLSFAKKKILELLSYLGSERVGLLVFSGTALVQCPLTRDFEAFKLFLDAIDIETLSSSSTDIGSAIESALLLFRQVPARKSKLLVVVTDGEDFSPNFAETALKAHQEGLSICALGIGTPEGAPIPLFDQSGKLTGYQKDEQGAVVMSRLNDALLQELVGDAGGLYVRAEQNSDADLEKLSRWVEKFEKERFGITEGTGHQELFMYITGLAFILLLIEWLL